MDAETLRYMIALQPQIKKAMGEWKSGDWYYNRLHGNDPQVVSEVAVGDFIGLSAPIELGTIRLPLPIDPRNPERGLWGMLDWDLFSTLTPRDGEWYIFGMNDSRTKGFCSEWCPPELALLKALACQEGVEVKG